MTGAVMTCVATGAYKSNTTPATSHARCPAPPPSPKVARLALTQSSGMQILKVSGSAAPPGGVRLR